MVEENPAEVAGHFFVSAEDVGNRFVIGDEPDTVNEKISGKNADEHCDNGEY